MQTTFQGHVWSSLLCLITVIALDGTRVAAQVGNGSTVARTASVTAVADERSNSIIVSGSDEQLNAIARMLKLLDTDVKDMTELRVFRLINADPDEMVALLSSMFPDPTNDEDSRGSGAVFIDPAAGPATGRGVAGNVSGGADDKQTRKRGATIAVSEPRTRSIVVSAAKQLMPQIAALVLRLDSDPAKKKVVKIYQLKNGNVTDVSTALHNIFDGANASSASSTQTDALQTRANQASQNQSTTSGFSLGGSGTGGGGASGGR